MVWYDAGRIERTVTRQFVVSHLLPEEVARLDRPLGFGDGLTDGTYWEWIDQKAKKIFLILVDLHVPDQIFGVIDDSWDDEDLPIAREHVERLALTPNRDDRFDRKFYHRQFHYLLKPLERSDAVTVYDDMEVVPLDVVDRRPSASAAVGVGSSGSGGSSGISGISGASGSHHGSHGSSNSTGGLGDASPGGLGLSGGGGGGSSSGSGERVVLPNYPGMVFSRRRVPLAPIPGSAYGAGYITLEEFQYEINSIKSVQNDHLVSYWTSYVHQGYGYVLFTPASDGSLKSLLATTPAPVKSLSKRDRRRLVFNWIHCLVDTLCFVHNRGLSHGNIKPSTVLFSHHHLDNHIFFSDFTHFGLDGSGGDGIGGGSSGIGGSGSSSHDKASFDKESYDYAAPEQWYRPSGSGSSSRKSTLTGEGGSGGRGAGMSMYAGSVYGGSGSSHNGAGGGLSMSPDHASSTGYAFQMGTSASFSISRINTAYGDGSGGYHASSSVNSAPIPQLNPQAADVFSLGCIILELMSFMLKRPTRSFATHRAAKHKTPGRGGAVLDSSFHKNLGQVESWMAALAKDAASSLSKKRGKDDYDVTLAGVAPMLHVVERMLALHASERPSAYDVQTRMYQILRDHCGIAEPHCVHEYGGFNMGWTDFGGSYASASTSVVGSYGTGGYFTGAASGGYSSPRLVTSATASSRAVSPTTMMAMSPTGGGYSWGSNSNGNGNGNSNGNSGAVSPVGLSRAGSFNYGHGSASISYHHPVQYATTQRTHNGRRPATSHQSGGYGHGRTDSGSGGSSARSSTIGGIGGASVIFEEETEGSTGNGSERDGQANDGDNDGKKGGFDLTNGLQAIRNLQIRDKVRQSWNAPVYAA